MAHERPVSNDYTTKARAYLEAQFERRTEDGVYFAHQPIYGFRTPHSEPWLFERYVRICLPEHYHLATALLRAVAVEMARTVSSSWERAVMGLTTLPTS